MLNKKVCVIGDNSVDIYPSQGSHMSGEMELTALSRSNETALMLGMLGSLEMMKKENS